MLAMDIATITAGDGNFPRRMRYKNTSNRLVLDKVRIEDKGLQSILNPYAFAKTPFSKTTE